MRTSPIITICFLALAAGCGGVAMVVSDTATQFRGDEANPDRVVDLAVAQLKDPFQEMSRSALENPYRSPLVRNPFAHPSPKLKNPFRRTPRRVAKTKTRPKLDLPELSLKDPFGELKNPFR